VSDEDEICRVLQQAAWLLFLVKPSIAFGFLQQPYIASNNPFGQEPSFSYFNLPDVTDRRLRWIPR